MQLLEVMDAREEKLTAAGELHRFNRDVAEALQRIQVGAGSGTGCCGRGSVLSGGLETAARTSMTELIVRLT